MFDFTPCPNYLQTRESALAYARSSQFFSEYVPAYFFENLLPAYTREIVEEISEAKQVNFDLVFLAFLASIAAADRGLHRVVNQAGEINSLSLLIAVGADSAGGKSRALEEFLSIFSDWERLKNSEVVEENRKREIWNDLLNERYRTRLKTFKASCDEDLIKELQECKDKQKELLQEPVLLLNDVTDAAYSIAISKQGYALRIESDGVLLPKKASRQITKYWEGESHRQSRVTRACSYASDPFIVDALFTQTKFFLRYVRDEDAIDSGVLGRTLVYKAPKQQYVAYRPPVRAVSENVLNNLHDKLFDLLKASERIEEQKFSHKEIFLTKEAEDLWGNQKNQWDQSSMLSNGNLHKIEEFGKRMGQHALRIAGILHVAEHPVPSEYQIDYATMYAALGVVDVAAQHMAGTRLGCYEDFQQNCTRDTFIWMLEKNIYSFSATYAKQSLKSKYKAADIDVALYCLYSRGLIKDPVPLQMKFGVGRPAGREFINPYYVPGAWVL